MSKAKKKKKKKKHGKYFVYVSLFRNISDQNICVKYARYLKKRQNFKSLICYYGLLN